MRNTAKGKPALVVDPVVTPPWLLYFLRIARDAQGDYAEAWASLDCYLPKGVRHPTLQECVGVLDIHHLA